VNRINSDLGFGGFVFAASSNSVNFLLRALQERRRLEILSRPQIMALDNQEGIIQVGQRVPRVQSVNQTQFGQTNSIIYEQVGIILRVRPRISPDGLVVMEVYANKSEVGAEIEGIPISISNDGTVLRAPRIDNTEAQTTISATSGQTVVLSGLLTKRSLDVHRRVPLIADIPLIGDLFRYDAVSEQRTELLIILTPRIVRDHLDAEMIKQVESSRMSWVLCDVINMHGPSGLRSRCDEWTDAECCAIYPTHVPTESDVVPLCPPEGPLMPPGSLEDPDVPMTPLSDWPEPLEQEVVPAGYGYDGPPPKEVRYAMEAGSSTQ
jgi:type II secretory pathway component GspD/PulD (secretin)